MTCPPHHWVIETANGPVSWGVCQICHEGKEFQNSIVGDDNWVATAAAKKEQAEMAKAKKQETVDHIGLPHLPRL